ncbi:hypothetical protein F0P96_17700 [Hymenobacter busanensis]|uniref:Uncharacterized protein n=1 Tax=Hymenobacter busanensis TaxID=2607656 RepID=A0A7L5A390_9BACT|nr:hypothetical protein [Hymenobacter busanensis]KAA9327074.1 hypothetical protein F0P96_17700 [Hymenobacter busanensis]QHJ09525.1 hypothetical protein GUY19_20515 [Hymenobacter busanensis]
MSSEGFTIEGESNSFLRVTFEEVYGFPRSTSPWGGYEVRARLEIASHKFSVGAEFWLSTGEVFQLYQQLQQCQQALSGSATYASYEHTLSFTAAYNEFTGHVVVTGKFEEQKGRENTVQFEFYTDQSFIQATLTQLREVVDKYGHMEGIH